MGNPSPGSLDVQGLSPCVENTLESETQTHQINTRSKFIKDQTVYVSAGR